MGPISTRRTKARIANNPAGTDGFEFVESAAPNRKSSTAVPPGWASRRLRVTAARRSLYGRAESIISERRAPLPCGRILAEHGPCAPAMAWRVVDAQHAFDRAVSLGAKPYLGAGKSIEAPAVVGIGGSLLYFVDRYGDEGVAIQRTTIGLESRSEAAGLGFFYLDHLTQMSCAATWTPGSGSMPRPSISVKTASSTSGQTDRPDVARPHLAGWQDPNPDQRKRRREQPDRRVSARLRRRRHPAHRDRDRRHLHGHRPHQRRRHGIHARSAGCLLRNVPETRRRPSASRWNG